MRPDTAARLYADDEVRGLFNEMREELKTEFARTPITNAESMVRIRMQLHAVDALESKLASLAHDHRRQKQ